MTSYRNSSSTRTDLSLDLPSLRLQPYGLVHSSADPLKMKRLTSLFVAISTTEFRSLGHIDTRDHERWLLEGEDPLLCEVFTMMVKALKNAPF